MESSVLSFISGWLQWLFAGDSWRKVASINGAHRCLVCTLSLSQPRRLSCRRGRCWSKGCKTRLTWLESTLGLKVRLESIESIFIEVLDSDLVTLVGLWYCVILKMVANYQLLTRLTAVHNWHQVKRLSALLTPVFYVVICYSRLELLEFVFLRTWTWTCRLGLGLGLVI